MTKFSFSSRMLGPALTHEQRARAWADFLNADGLWDVDCPNPDGFAARAEVLDLPGLRVSSAQATSIRLTRTRRAIQASRTDDVILLVNDGGTLGGIQAGREQVLRNGDAVVLDFAVPHISHADRGGRALAVTLPREALERHLGAKPSLAPNVIDRRTDALRLLRGYLRMLLSSGRPLDAEVALATANHVTDLVRLIVGSAPLSPSAPERLDAAGAARVALIIEAIGRRCGEHTLDAAAVGQQLQLSARSVQHLLQHSGTTFSDELREARIARAAEMLQSTRFAHLTIAAIAQDCGFVDLSTFNRAVKARFGCTPRDLRSLRGA